MAKKDMHTTEVPENVAYEPEDDDGDVGGVLEPLNDFEEEEAVESKSDKRRKQKVDDERLKIEEKRKKIDDVKEKEKKVYEALVVDNYENLLSTCYSELDVNVEMICVDKVGYGCIVVGKGGTGKTFRILNQSIGFLGQDAVVYTDSFTTPTALYVTLYENRDKELIILDDCADLMNNNKILAILKGGLWHINDGKTRIINYSTTKPPKDEYGDDLPRSFELNARLIIITNYLSDDNPHVKAILSRVNKITVDVPRKELLSILKQVIKKDYYNLDFGEREEVLNYLEENTNNQTEELNIRSLLRMMDYRVWAKNHRKGDAWKTLCLKLLQSDSRLALVEAIMDDPTLLSADDRWMKFVDLTGESRATYYRLAKKIAKRRKDLEQALKK